MPLYLEGVPYPGGRIGNRAAFAISAAQQTHGSWGRSWNCDGSRGPVLLRQVDLTLRRQFNFGERANLQVRAERFNVFNHPRFGAPDRNLANRVL